MRSVLCISASTRCTQARHAGTSPTGIRSRSNTTLRVTMTARGSCGSRAMSRCARPKAPPFSSPSGRQRLEAHPLRRDHADRRASRCAAPRTAGATPEACASRAARSARPASATPRAAPRARPRSCRASPSECAFHRPGAAARQIPLEVDLLVDLDRREPGPDQVVLPPTAARARLRQVRAHPERVVADVRAPRRRGRAAPSGLERMVHVRPRRRGPPGSSPAGRQSRPGPSMRSATARASIEGSGPRRDCGLVASRYVPPSGPGRNAMPWSKSGTAALRARTIEGCAVEARLHHDLLRVDPHRLEQRDEQHRLVVAVALAPREQLLRAVREPPLAAHVVHVADVVGDEVEERLQLLLARPLALRELGGEPPHLRRRAR